MTIAAVTVFEKGCPHCRSIDYRTVGARNAVERFLYPVIKPYRCELCGHHFFLFRMQAIPEGTA